MKKNRKKNRLARNAPGDFATPFSLPDPCAPTRRRLLQGLGGGVGLALGGGVTSILQPRLSAAAQSPPSTDRLIRTFVGHVGVASVAFSPDGRAILSGGADSVVYGAADKRLKLWEVATGKELRTFRGRSNIVQAVAFSPDSRTALSGSDDNTLKLWDVASGQELRTFTADAISSVALSPDGRTALSGGGRSLKLSDVATGKELRTFTSTGPSGLVGSVAFSPDGRTALSGSADGVLRLWDVATGKELNRFTAHPTSTVGFIAFSPDGRTALTASGTDGTMRLSEVATGKELRRFMHPETVKAVAFSRDGRIALSCTHAGQSGVNALRLWEVATGKELFSFMGHSKGLTSVAVAPDGRTAVSASGDTTLKLWDLTGL